MSSLPSRDDQQALQQSILQKETITISEVLLLLQDTASLSLAQTSTASQNSLLLASQPPSVNLIFTPRQSLDNGLKEL
jgi:hypothetical protein